MYPPAFPHDPIVSIFDNIFLVRGSIRVGPGMRMSRNMVIVRDGEVLTLINPVRLSEAELLKLERLGWVHHVMRLGDFHGLDDRFYIDRYNAEFWCQPGQTTYRIPAPDHLIDADVLPPFPEAEFFVFSAAQYPEAALLLKNQKLLVTTDSIQYWPDWLYTSLFTRLVLRLMGFRRTLLIGGPWLKRVTPKGASLLPDFERLLALDFDHLVAAHGGLLREQAKPLLMDVLARTFRNAPHPLSATSHKP